MTSSQASQTAQTIVVKIGTSSITDDEGAIHREAVADLCDQVADAREAGHRVVIVTSGAIAAGLPELGLGGVNRPSDMITLQAAATVGQGALIRVYREELARRGLVAGQVLLVAIDFIMRSQYLHARSTMSKLIDLGVIPVVNENDAIADDEIRFGDNDRLAALVANLVDADLLLLLTDTAGVFTSDPRISDDAALIEEIERIGNHHESLGGTTGTSRGSGGMSSKIMAAKVASWSGVRSVIADSKRPDVVADAIVSKAGTGTFVKARPGRMSARKLWIAFAVGSHGSVVVDAGARAALERGTSLLAAGVRDVSGSFGAGDPIEIAETGGEVFARGLARHSIEELKPAIGLRSADLSPGSPHVVVHADDLVVLPD